MNENKEISDKLNRERGRLLRYIENKLELPMIVLGIIWFILLILELTKGLSRSLEVTSLVIWGIFILDFLLKFFLAPSKRRYLGKNILTLISLMVPALRVFRIIRFFRLLRTLQAARGIRMVRLVTSANRGIRALGNVMERRGFGYVVLITVAVTFLGAAGMYAFERGAGSGFDDYGTSLWRTAMLVSSIPTEEWPRTSAGRTLYFLISLYGFATFGYVTATLASFFVGSDSQDRQGKLAGAGQVQDLKKEILLLRGELAKFKDDEEKGASGKK